MAVFVISYEPNIIIDLADEIVMIDHGVITDQGPKDELFPKILANTLSGCSFIREEA